MPVENNLADVPTCMDETHQIYFASDQTELDDVALQVIDAITEQAATCEYAAIEVIGHTDSIGSEDVNIRVSQRRADTVLEALLDAELAIDQIAIVAAGERGAKTEDDLIVPMNRRVEIRMIQ